MEALGTFGVMGFIFGLVALSRVKRLERTLRENGIRPQSGRGLGKQLRERVGQSVTLSLYTPDGDVAGQVCKLLDADEDWALVLLDEGKKRERQQMIRLDDVKGIKG